MGEKIYLDGITAEELTNKFLSKVDSKFKDLENRLNEKFNSEFPLLSRKKTVEILEVSEATLFNWNKRGILKPFQLGGRVYYRLEDINNALVKLQ